MSDEDEIESNEIVLTKVLFLQVKIQRRLHVPLLIETQ